MAIANDGTGIDNTKGLGTTASITSFTVGTGSNRLLVASMCFASQGVASVAATWNSVALTQAQRMDNALGSLQHWVLINPTSGNLTFSASWTTSCNFTLALSEYSGADQTTGFQSADNSTASGTSTAVSIVVTSTTDGATVASTLNGTNTYSAETQTQIFRLLQGTVATDGTFALGGTSNTHGFTISSSGAWIAAGIHLLAASGGGGGIPAGLAGGLLGVIFPQRLVVP